MLCLLHEFRHVHCKRRDYAVKSKVPKSSKSWIFLNSLTYSNVSVVSLLRNKDQQDALFFLIYFNNQPLHDSNRLTIHHQEVALLYIRHMVFLMLRIYLNFVKLLKYTLLLKV